jgi:hypothetical protein
MAEIVMATMDGPSWGRYKGGRIVGIKEISRIGIAEQETRLTLIQNRPLL